MTYKSLQDEVIALRFDESMRASVKLWLNNRYAWIWDQADWHFKHVKGASLTVTGSDNTPTMPSDFAKSEGLFAPDGSELYYIDPRTWREWFLDPTVASSNPSEVYTVIAREIWLGPTPSAAGTYTLAYERRLAHVDGGTGNVAAGVMSADADQPIWDAEYDYLLVLEALRFGKQLMGDPTWTDHVAERDSLLQAMRDDLVTGQKGSLEVWGEPCL